MKSISSICLGLAIWLGQVRLITAQEDDAGDYGAPYTSDAPLGYSSPCCEAIQVSLPGKVIFPSTAQYSAEQRSYWSLEESDVSPACFVRPATGLEVSTIIKILNQPQYDAIPSCRFAIRSGGHQTWGGASSIQGGVTIDLSDLNRITVYQQDNVVSIEPGSRWQNVYDALEPLQLAVSGGRWGNVGVGGLLTGGGLSFFQGTYSLACDNIVNHEVVLSNGTIVNANTKENADLHKALKGGNNNFGIVTRFDVRGFPQGRIWSGHAYSSAGRQYIPSRWFESFASSRNNDLGGMVMFYANYVAGRWVSQSFLSYSRPQENPQVFTGLLNASSSVNTDITTMQEVARENAAATPTGTRSSFSTFTFINSASFMDALLDLGTEYANSLPSISTINLIFQPLWTKPRLRSFEYGGGNVLGLENERRDLVIVLVHTIWGDVARSYQVKQSMETFINRAQQLAKQMGVYHPYLYLNYAESFQDVMGSYGPESMKFMLNVSQKYDPIQLWQRRVPGGFKLRAREPLGASNNSPVGPSQPARPATQGPPTGPVVQGLPTGPAGQYAPPISNGNYPPNVPIGQYPPSVPYGQPLVTSPYGLYPPQSPYGLYPPQIPYGLYPPTGTYDQGPPAPPYYPYAPASTYGQYPPNGPATQNSPNAPFGANVPSGAPVSQPSPNTPNAIPPTNTPARQSSSFNTVVVKSQSTSHTRQHTLPTLAPAALQFPPSPPSIPAPVKQPSLSNTVVGPAPPVPHGSQSSPTSAPIGFSSIDSTPISGPGDQYPPDAGQPALGQYSPGYRPLPGYQLPPGYQIPPGYQPQPGPVVDMPPGAQYQPTMEYAPPEPLDIFD